MKRLSALVFLGLAASLALPADAGGPRRSAPILGQPVLGVHPTAPAAVAPSFRQPVPRTRLHGVRPFAPFVGGVVYGAPPVAYAVPAYVDLPVADVVPPAVPPVPAAPPPPPRRDVVDYSDGRYELRGDGITVPYRWAWIPNPPPPPTARGPEVTLYAWTDEQGTLHVTDRLDKVPERHRAQAKRNATS
jgi:hypothetical protein